MKKLLMCAVAATAFSTSAMAGGLLTNTNQNAAFLRQMSQDAIIDITGLYANPAGTAFLSNGWHLSLNIQTAIQQRDITTSFPRFTSNVNNPYTSHKFDGDALAPVIPSFQLSYNHDKWSVSANFALGGGGGKCEFENGLGSFEAAYAEKLFQSAPTMQGLANMKFGQNPLVAANPMLSQVNPDYQYTGYSMDAYMKGRSYIFGLTLGGTYKFTDNFAGYLGVRMQYATNSYNGYVKNVKAHLHSAVLGGLSSQLATAMPAEAAMLGAAADQEVVLDDVTPTDLYLNSADQSGFGVCPVIGFDFRLNEHWNFACKYEVATYLNLSTSSDMNPVAQAQAADPTNALSQFADGNEVREDIPAMLTLGVQYSPIKTVRLNAGFHEYFDKQGTKFGNKQKLIDTNTWELNFGAEWDLCKWVTLSASWQTTQYGLSDAYMNDLSFNLSNHMIGAGLRINAAKCCTVDLGYMHTIYGDRTVTSPTAAGNKVDVYSRTNDVFGIGVNLHF